MWKVNPPPIPGIMESILLMLWQEGPHLGMGAIWPRRCYSVSAHWAGVMLLPVFPQISSVQFSCSVVSISFWSHELQHARPPCPSPTPGVHLGVGDVHWVSDGLMPMMKLMSIESVMPSNHLIPCHPLLLPLSVCSSFRVISSHQVAKVLALQFQHQSFQWIFRVDFL